MSDFEIDFWRDCTNTFGEETKQFVYARHMGLVTHHDGRSPFNIELHGAHIIDIGGGPVSLLLKCANRGHCVVVDPLAEHWPAWVDGRYEAAGIDVWRMRAEDMPAIEIIFHEAWIYNVLQHVDDPLKIIANAKRVAGRVRLFEWIDLPPHPGHPHMLTEKMLTEALAPGRVHQLNEAGCVGRAFTTLFH